MVCHVRNRLRLSMSRKRTKITGDNSALSDNPFASALGALADTPAEPDALDPEPALAPEPTPRDLDLGRRAIVRRQSKGQGGKTVSCVEGLPIETATAMLPRLKRELGCGGRVYDGVLMLGTRDHARVADWLRSAGVPRVTLGN